MEVHFCPVLSDTRNSMVLFEGSQASPALLSDKRKFKMMLCAEHWFDGTDRGKGKYHICHMDRRGTETWPWRLEIAD
jgi:hypothetical protein